MSEKKLILDSLGAIVAQKRLRYQALGMMNINGLDEVERARSSMIYSQAHSELWNAERDLQAEIARQGLCKN